MLLLFFTMIIPQILGALRLVFYSPSLIFGTVYDKEKRSKYGKLGFSMLTFLLTPFLTIIFHIKMNLLDLKLKYICPLNNELIEEWETIKWFLSKHIKLEFGLESIHQLSIQLVLLCMALFPETTTATSLERIFLEDGKITEIILILLILSTFLSITSGVTAHITILSAKREHFPLMSKLLAGLYCFIMTTTKTLGTIMYFTPALGLFKLLRHVQAEQTPWDPILEEHFVKEDIIQFGNSPNIHWSQINRWNDGQPPHYTLYTIFTLGQYFFGYLLINFIHALIIFLMKHWMNEIFTRFHVLDKIIIAIENTNLPYNVEEWDSGKGDAMEHKKRMHANKKEVLILMILNTVFMVIHLIPLGILGKDKLHRQARGSLPNV